jgi:predicted esterase
MLIRLSLLAKKHQSKKLGKQRSKKAKEPEKAGEAIKASDYSNTDNWLAKPTEITSQADVFMLYPTAYAQKNENSSPVAKIDNPTMRAGAQVFLATQGSAFDTSGNVYAPYYRQLDAKWLLTKSKEEQAQYTDGVPKADVMAAFDYYIKHENNNRPFILVGHSQGARMLKAIMYDYFKNNPGVSDRMIAAYVLGQSVTQQEMNDNPQVKFATGPDDTGVVISYNTVAPDFTGTLPTWDEGALAINPINWRTDGTPATAEENLGSYVRNDNGDYSKVMNLADATVDGTRGLVVSSTVDKAKYEMPESTRKIFPAGSFHNNDISFYYYNLQQNAENREAQYFAMHPQGTQTTDPNQQPAQQEPQAIDPNQQTVQ